MLKTKIVTILLDSKNIEANKPDIFLLNLSNKNVLRDYSNTAELLDLSMY